MSTAQLIDRADGYVYRMLATAPPLEPAEFDSVDSALEVMVLWGECVLHVAHLSPPRPFWVGEDHDGDSAQAADFTIGHDSLGMQRLPITLEDASGPALVLPPDGSGELRRGEQWVDLEQLRAQQQLAPCAELAGARLVPLAPGAEACLRYRGFTFVVRLTRAARRVGVGAQAFELDRKALPWTMISLGVHLACLGLFYLLPPHAGVLSTGEQETQRRLTAFLIEQREAELEPPVFLDPGPQHAGEPGGKAERGEPGKAGDQKQPDTKRRFAVQGDSPQPELPREAQEQAIAQESIIGILQGAAAWNAPTSPYGRDNALGADPVSALGALMGPQIGASWGLGGLGMYGTGRHGGGNAEGTIGAGGLNTIGGAGRGRGGQGYGANGGLLGGVRTPRVPIVRPAHADIRGSLSKEAIRRVIRVHLNEIKYCYQQRLVARPDLQGRVAVKFIVAPTGAVQVAAKASSDLGDAQVEQCIVSTVARWTFPAPEGGGIVVVTYPFMLTQSGG